MPGPRPRATEDEMAAPSLFVVVGDHGEVRRPPSALPPRAHARERGRQSLVRCLATGSTDAASCCAGSPTRSCSRFLALWRRASRRHVEADPTLPRMAGPRFDHAWATRVRTARLGSTSRRRASCIAPQTVLADFASDAQATRSRIRWTGGAQVPGTAALEPRGRRILPALAFPWRLVDHDRYIFLEPC